MPELDGLGVLEAIRSSGEFADLPVVSVTGVSDKALVLKLVNFGIVDFILKPIQIEPVRRRLGKILSELVPRTSKIETGGREDGSLPSLLVVDTDPGFTRFTTGALESEFAVLSSNSGAEALGMVRNFKPDVVLLGEGLPLMNERLLATAIRRDQEVHSTVNLLTRRQEVFGDEAQLYDGVIRKSDVAETLLDRV